MIIQLYRSLFIAILISDTLLNKERLLVYAYILTNKSLQSDINGFTLAYDTEMRKYFNDATILLKFFLDAGLIECVEQKGKNKLPRYKLTEITSIVSIDINYKHAINSFKKYHKKLGATLRPFRFVKNPKHVSLSDDIPKLKEKQNNIIMFPENVIYKH